MTCHNRYSLNSRQITKGKLYWQKYTFHKFKLWIFEYKKVDRIFFIDSRIMDRNIQFVCTYYTFVKYVNSSTSHKKTLE